jgi:phosphomannomutase
MYVAACGARGGIAITASHNPPEYNALKLFNEQGQFFNHYERGGLIDLYHQGDFAHAADSEVGHTREELGSPARIHFERVLAHVDRERIRRRAFRVALDAVNGAGSVLTPRFLTEELGCRLSAISIDPSKPFPREAEPGPESLAALSALVRETGADIGFAQDPDGDRLAVARPDGEILDNDEVLALVVDAVLARMPGDVAVNLTTSAAIDEVARSHGRRVHRTPVGEANVVEKMLATKAVIGGEGANGGIVFPAVHYCRDSYTGMAFLLDRMAATGCDIGVLAGRLPRYYRRAAKVPFAHGRLAPAMRAFEARFPDAARDRLDGLKLMWPEAWLHVRASNTEPVLRISVESKSAERTAALLEAGVAILNS